MSEAISLFSSGLDGGCKLRILFGATRLVLISNVLGLGDGHTAMKAYRPRSKMLGDMRDGWTTSRWQKGVANESKSPPLQAPQTDKVHVVLFPPTIFASFALKPQALLMTGDY